MAEPAVSFVLDKLNDLEEEDLKLFGVLREEVRKIKEELQWSRSFVKDADAREVSDERIRIWVKQLREVAYDIENVVDQFIFHQAQLRREREPLICLVLVRLYHHWKILLATHEAATQFRDLRERLRIITERSEKYHFIEQGSHSSISRLEQAFNSSSSTPMLLEESQLVGISQSVETLIKWLEEEDRRLVVVSVCGLGGVGKTTLVRKVYNSPMVNGYFECQAWVTASPSFEIGYLLRALINQLFNQGSSGVLEKEDNEVLTEMLCKYLKQRRYLVVLDDVWTEDAWRSIKNALPDNGYGSRIMVTTRQTGLARSIATMDHVYNLQCLSAEDSWILFLTKAFNSDDHNSCPPHLEEISKEILRRCYGLPLAISVVAGYLSLQDPTKWIQVSRKLGGMLEHNPLFSDVETILSLSYNDLPDRLKYCFLYLTIFPEDYSIKCSRLLRLWVAEGFVERVPRMTMEEIAEDYLHELITRNLIQVGDTDLVGRVKTCRAHGIMYRLILSKARDQFGTVSLYEGAAEVPHHGIRRLSILDTQKIPERIPLHLLRSFFMFRMTTDLPTLISGFMLLQVLDLEDAPLQDFPSKLVNLFHLRYLSLKNTRIGYLPRSLGKLRNLETLDLKGTYVSELPTEILKLQHLRNLLVYRCWTDKSFRDKEGVRMPLGTGRLTDLQKLSCLDARNGGAVIKELGMLTQLRKLGIMNLRREDGIHLCESIEKMKHLFSFDVASIQGEVLYLQSLSPSPLLQRLHLQGFLEELPHWVFELVNLVKLELKYSRLRDNPLTLLQKLPNLMELTLQEAYDGEQLCFEARGFPRLKSVALIGLDQLHLVKVEEGAMPTLGYLWITDCKKLENVPVGIEHLTNLKQVVFSDMPDEFRMQLLPSGEGEDYFSKVAPIPNIRFV